MKQTIRLYVTTRKDPVPDLDDMKTAAELAGWKKDVKRHALKIAEYPGPNERMIADVAEYQIAECYAVIAYPPGKMVEANSQVGTPLLKFLRSNEKRLNWNLQETGLSAVTVAEHAEKSFGQEYREVSGDGIPAEVDGETTRLDASRLWDNFTYGLVADKSLGADDYEVDLEVVVRA